MFDAKTANVAKSLADLVSREKCHPGSVDFDILKVHTYIKEPLRDEFALVEKAHLEKLKDKNFLIDPKLTFAQEYEVRFKPLAVTPFKFYLTLGTDKFKSMASVTLKAGSVIKSGVDQKVLYSYFNKLKLRNNMIIYLMDDQLRSAVAKLAQIANDKPFEKDITFALCNWAAPIETIDDRLDILFEKKDEIKEDSLERVDHAERGFVNSVQAGDILVKYQMPKQGVSGRSFDGKFIAMLEPKIANQPTFSIDDQTVEVKEEGGAKLYVAKTNGCAKLEDNTLHVEQAIELDSIHLKSTGNIKAGIDNGVVVRVGKTDGKNTSAEAIGPDMIVEASEVIVQGSIASGVIITAKKIIIKGQTHQKSTLNANEIEANVLRGTAQSDKIKVLSLEGGIVQSTASEIGQAVGGEIRGEKIVVLNLRGKVTCRATDSITIRQVTKGENKLIIDPGALEKEGLEVTREEIEKLRGEIEKIRKESKTLTSYLAKNKNAFTQIQEKILQNKKDGVATGETFLKMAREYLTSQKKYDGIDEQIKAIEAEIDAKKEGLEKFDKLVLKSFVLNETGLWSGHNEVVFKLPFLGKDFVKNIDDMRIKKVELVESDDEDANDGYKFKLTYA
jgi:hypothetical protein